MKLRWILMLPLVYLLMLFCIEAPPPEVNVELKVNTNPTGCQVFFNGEPGSDTTNCVLYFETYLDSIDTVVIVRNEFNIRDTILIALDSSFNLDSMIIMDTTLIFSGNLTISAVDTSTGEAIGAQVILDGDTGTGWVTPVTIKGLLAGPHALILAREGNSAYTNVITVLCDSTVEIVGELGNEFGHVVVNSEPDGAEIWGDGFNTSRYTPAFITGIPVGEHIVELKLEGYMDWVDTVEVFKDKITNIYAVLEPLTGSIQVNSEPDSADVFLDGEYTNHITDCLLDSVSVGSHTILLQKPNYSDWDTTIIVSKDDTVDINVILDPLSAAWNIQKTIWTAKCATR